MQNITCCYDVCCVSLDEDGEDFKDENAATLLKRSSSNYPIHATCRHVKKLLN